MVILMTRLVLAAAVLAAMGSTVAARPAAKLAATLPQVGDTLTVWGAPTWSTREWLYDVPSEKDAAGKVVIHWFCAPKVATCVEDLARIVTLKENGRVYVVAHIGGTKAQAKKLDPIRESEGVGRGTLAFGAGVRTMMKQMGITGPASIVVGLDGKAALVTTSPSPAELDARDKKVNDLVAGIKEYTVTRSAPPSVKPGERFTFSIKVQLASWLTYDRAAPMELVLTAPGDFTCDRRRLQAEHMQIDGQTLTATTTCSAPKGSYEARGELRFGFRSPSGGAGVGSDGARWKFEIKP